MKLVKGKLRWFIMGPVTAAASILLLAAATKPVAPCDVAAAWLNAHRATLPQTYDAFIAYPELYRKAIYPQLPRSTQQAFWTVQLNRYIATHPSTTAQREFIVNLRDHLGAYFADPQVARGALVAERVPERARALFGDSIAKNLLERLGPADPPAGAGAAFHEASVLGDPMVFVRFAVAKVRAFRQIPNCSCSTQSDYCGEHNNCSSSGVQCRLQQRSCGTFELYDCDGLCYFEQ